MDGIGFALQRWRVARLTRFDRETDDPAMMSTTTFSGKSGGVVRIQKSSTPRSPSGGGAADLYHVLIAETSSYRSRRLGARDGNMRDALGLGAHRSGAITRRRWQHADLVLV